MFRLYLAIIRGNLLYTLHLITVHLALLFNYYFVSVTNNSAKWTVISEVYIASYP
jgi:hypothetical protein